MKLPATAHTSRPWRIHEVAHDLRLEDVWEVPVTLGPDDFPRFVQVIASFDLERSTSTPVRLLVAIRTKLGERLGWDESGAGFGSRVTSLRDRLPADLRTPAFDVHLRLPFRPLLATDDEWAGEAANRTMHGVLHLGRVPRQDGGFGVQLAVLVKPNGLAGTAYMAAIKPFRYLVVYPQLLRAIERAWKAEAAVGR